jgi:hypothetical protein
MTGLMQESESASLPVYFPVSITKFLVMHFCTLGTYQFYWFYENWKIIREREHTAISPFWRTFFAFIFCYALFEAIRNSAASLKMPQLASTHVLATVWILLSMLWILPDPYWLASFLSICLLVPIQQMATWVNQSSAPNADRNDRFTAWNKFAIAIGGPLFVVGAIAAFLPRV